MKNYKQQAQDFLTRHNAKMDAKLLGHYQYFPKDEEARDVWEITLSREGKRPYVFKFGQSIAQSGNRKKVPPTPYDVLSCLQKYEIGSFEDFCNEFGYSADSITARDTYIGIVAEYKNVLRMFGDCMHKIQDIN